MGDLSSRNFFGVEGWTIWQAQNSNDRKFLLEFWEGSNRLYSIGKVCPRISKFIMQF